MAQPGGLCETALKFCKKHRRKAGVVGNYHGRARVALTAH
jgi:hypothetical protein